MAPFLAVASAGSPAPVSAVTWLHSRWVQGRDAKLLGVAGAGFGERAHQLRRNVQHGAGFEGVGVVAGGGEELAAVSGLELGDGAEKDLRELGLQLAQVLAEVVAAVAVEHDQLGQAKKKKKDTEAVPTEADPAAPADAPVDEAPKKKKKKNKTDSDDPFGGP